MTAILIMTGLAALCVALGLDQVFSLGWSGGSAPVVSSAETLTGNTTIETEFTLAAGTVTNQEQTFGFLHTGIKAILIVVEGNTGTVTMKTNSSGSPDDTLVFPANGARYYWDETFPTIDTVSATPFDAAVTTTFWTVTSTTDVTVKVRILYDA